MRGARTINERVADHLPSDLSRYRADQDNTVILMDVGSDEERGRTVTERLRSFLEDLGEQRYQIETVNDDEAIVVIGGNRIRCFVQETCWGSDVLERQAIARQ